MYRRIFCIGTSLPLAVIVAALLAGCAGLQQFPEVSRNFSEDLSARDPEYMRTAKDIEAAAADPEKQRRLRNQAIDIRLRVIDLNFNDFLTKLAKENVRADFGVAAVQVGVGAAGSLVAETASQILSAMSGGLVGLQGAYGKAALFEQALPSLLAQMIASRNEILVRISEQRVNSIEAYSLGDAVRDLDAYNFAGSLPGALIATSADAKVKNDGAAVRLAKFRVVLDDIYGVDSASNKLRDFWKPGSVVDSANRAKIDQCMTKAGLAIGPGTLAALINSRSQAVDRRQVVACLGL